MTVIKPISVPTKRLQASITATASSFQLSDILGWDGDDLTASDFGVPAYAVFRNANNTQIEIMEIDSTTIASSSITITRRGLDYTGDLTTEDTARKFSWTKGTFVELGTHFPQLYQWLKEYIDAAAIAGGVPATTTVLGLNKMSVAPASAASPIAVGDNDPRVALASTSAYGIVEEATQGETDAGTGTGGTGARLFLNPSTILSYLTLIGAFTTAFKYAVGALDNARVKTYFNVHLLFNLWTGAVVNDTTTTFPNWVRTSEVTVQPGGAMAEFDGTGSEYLSCAAPMYQSGTGGDTIQFSGSKTIIMDWWGYLPTTSTGDITMGFTANPTSAFLDAYNTSTYNKVAFTQSAAGTIYATISKAGTGVTNTSVASGYTAAQWNNFRIELTLGSQALFYINGTLKATLSGANLPTSVSDVAVGSGRSNTAVFVVSAPNLSLQMV